MFEKSKNTVNQKIKPGVKEGTSPQDLRDVFNEVFTESEEILNNLAEGIKGSISPDTTLTDLNALANGRYSAERSGTYKFSPALQIVDGEAVNVVPEGYDLKFIKDASGWRVASVVKMPTIQVANKVEQGNDNAVQSGAVFTALGPVKDMVDSVLVTVEGDPYNTTNSPSASTSVSSVHGYSFPIGEIPTSFTKVTVYFAQKTDTPVSELEIRFLKVNASGELILKKRFTIEPNLVTHTSYDLIFDDLIILDGEIWCQIMTNNPMSLRRVSPAEKFTAANGYAAARATATNDLNNTTFELSQVNIDILLTFNNVEDFEKESNFTSYGKRKLISIIKENSLSRNVDLVWNCVGHSIWWQDNVIYNGTSNIARGIQTIVREKFQFARYNKYCYSGRSLGALTPTGDNNSITTYFSQWLDNSKGFWTIDTIGNDFKRNIPIGTVADYDNATGVTTYYGALRAFNDKVISLTGDDFTSKIIATTPTVRVDNIGVNTQGHTLLDYERALKTVCSKANWLCVDQKRLSGFIIEDIDITTLDGTHPNDFGYSILGNYWVSVFLSLLT